MDIRISQPPTNSLSTYNCGMVGQSEYSLIPSDAKPSVLRESKTTEEGGGTQRIHTLSKFRVLQDVKSSELLRVDTLKAQNLYSCSRKATLGRLGSALHEQNNRRRSHCLVDGGFCLRRKKASLERGQSKTKERFRNRDRGQARSLPECLQIDL